MDVKKINFFFNHHDREQQHEEGFSCSLIHSPSAHDKHSWARPRPGTPDRTWQGLVKLLVASRAHEQDAELKMEQARLSPDTLSWLWVAQASASVSVLRVSVAKLVLSQHPYTATGRSAKNNFENIL